MKRLAKILFIPAAMMIAVAGFAQVRDNTNMQNASPPVNNTTPHQTSPSPQQPINRTKPANDPMQQHKSNNGDQYNGMIPSNAQQQIQEHAGDSIRQVERRETKKGKKEAKKAKKHLKKSKWKKTSDSTGTPDKNQESTPDQNPPE